MGVKKKLFFVWNIVLLAFTLAIVVSAMTEKIIIDINEGVLRNGKNITFVGSTEDSANFNVDGQLGTVTKGETETISGVIFNLIGLSAQPKRAIINITIDFVCGNWNCESSLGEDTSSCCADCGCLSLKKICSSNRCVENITIKEPGDECGNDNDCIKEGTTCIKYTCDKSLTPNKCAEEQIASCIAGDNCCPSQCTEESDADCKVLDSCSSESNCNDNNPCTEDFCSGTPKKCNHQAEGGCPEGNICISIGDRKEFYYCEMPGEWKYLKVKGTACIENYECLEKKCRNGGCAEGGIGNIYLYGLVGFFIVLILTVISYVYLGTRKSNEN